jgi:hypothetical protein
MQNTKFSRQKISRKLIFKLLLLFVAMYSVPMSAQCNPVAGDQAAYGQDTWIGYVYNGYTNGNPPAAPFTGTYRGYVTETQTFSHDYGNGAISGANVCGTYADYFAVRYKMKKTFAPGYYRFSATGDDGIRLSIDGGANYITQASSWTNHGAITYTADYAITTPTELSLVLDYYEAAGGAVVGFSYQQLSCYATAPTQITGNIIYSCNGTTTLTAGGGTENGAGYQWGHGSVVGTNPISGVGTASMNVSQPGTYWVRRAMAAPCNAYTDGFVTTVTTSNNTPGDPAIFGNNAWTSYVYYTPTNASPMYKGYYTATGLGIDSETSWGTNASPSAAATYLGCPVENDYFMFDYKRKGFTCGEYNIKLQKWDDRVRIFIDGNEINLSSYNLNNGTGGAVNPNYYNGGGANVNLGNYNLNANSTIEVRVTEDQGGANVKLDIVALSVQPTAITGTTVICPGGQTTLTAQGGLLGTGQAYQWGTGTVGSNIISGANTATVTVTPAQKTTTYWVRIVPTSCTTADGVATLTVVQQNTWTGAVNTDWNNAGNWTCGVPTSVNPVTIPFTSHNPVVMSGTMHALDLLLNANTSLTVLTGATLQVENGIVNNGNLTVQNNAALVQVNNVANTGDITVKRNSNPLFRQDYSFWAAPVAAQQLQAFSPATLSNRFYTYGYNFTGGIYKEAYLPETATNNFIPGKAYLIRMPNVVAGLAGYDDAQTAYTHNGNFTGVPNNGTVAVIATLADLQNTSNTVNQAGHFTAVGNPYPSPISVKDFFTQNAGVLEAGNGIYFWRKKNDGNATSYAHLTMLGFTANSATGGDIANGGASFYQSGNGSTFNVDWIISPGQGFLVKFAANPTGPISFTNSMRRAANINGTQPFFRTANTTDEAPEVSRLWLNLTNANNAAFSQTAIGYLDGATLGLDYGYDARALGEGNAKFYSVAGEDNMAIQARPPFVQSDVVPMGFAVTAAGQYNITLDHYDGVFSNGQNVYLKDNLTGTTTSLSEGTYSFTTDAGTFNSRFEVVYTTEAALGTETPVLANSVVVYQQNGTININSGSIEMTGVTIYDIRGRVLFNNNKVNGTETTVSNLGIANQVIIIEIQTVSGKVSKKIVY